MVETKSLADTVKNWNASHGRIPQAYSEGVNRTQNFVQKAIDGQSNYVEAMSDQNVLNRRAANLSKITDQDWKNAATQKGSKNIVTGMKLAEGKFSSGMGKNLAVIQGVTLPARSRDGMTNLMNRAGPIVTALENMKKGGQ